MSDGELTVVTLNALGIPRAGARLAERYTAIGDRLDAGDADVVCLQEVMTWWHLRLLARRMRSFRHVCYRRTPAGPGGGLVTFSRRPVSGFEYTRFGLPPRAPGIARSTRYRNCMKGVLVSRLRQPGLSVVSTHPLANWDGDWSPSNRFYPLHRAQLGALTAVLRGVPGQVVVCGDFNVDRDSSLMREFITDTGLSDAFGGTCPPTFRAEYLPPGATPHCIDFILTSQDVKTTNAALLFADKVPLPSGP
ncbi:MAG TPA: endonuclease/exonuclease/phosphatase family protein, partial [Streptosporangiaceae bacterium]|nr:endonuclease/exonuclease/phosphatase family protein [Streptosporangiaceae bacterium]